MNLSGVYQKFSKQQIQILTAAWLYHRNLPLHIGVLPFADVRAVIISLEVYADSVRNKQAHDNVRHLIKQLMNVWHTGTDKIVTKKGREQKVRKKWKKKRNQLTPV